MTLADAIRDHVECQRIGDDLMSQINDNDRRMAECYQVIRDAMSRPEMARAAVVDHATKTVYTLMPDGLVYSLRAVSSYYVDVGDLHAESAVTIGETS